MTSRTDIERWAAAGESEVSEFKRTTGERREAAQTLCAMLNCRGGRVLFGVDRTGRVTGQDVTDKTLEDVAQEIKEIEPPVFPSIERVPVGGGREVIVVSVSAGHSRPYSVRGRAFRRVGNTSPAMTRDEYNRVLMERMHAEVRWENEPSTRLGVTDLDASEVTRTVDEAIRRGRMEEPGTRDLSELLRGLGLLRSEGMLRAAAVLFGKPERLEFEMPQCLLRVARFRGTDKSEFIDNRQFHGNAFRLMVLAERFMRENLPIAGRIVPGLFERQDDPLYPPEALREALANAFCHRDYSIGGGSVSVGVYDDRLEITSSGTLHFGLTPADLYLPHESLKWNPLIAGVFYRRGVIESWGRGTLKVVEMTERAGLARPEIEVAGGCVVMRFRLDVAQPSRHHLSGRQRHILKLISSHGPCSLAQVKTLAGGDVTSRALQTDLQLLKRMGLVKPVGYARGARWQSSTAIDRNA